MVKINFGIVSRKDFLSLENYNSKLCIVSFLIFRI